MKKYLLLLIALSSILMSGCSNLPETRAKLKLTIDNKDYLLETTKNQAEREKGLMDRQSIASDSGMIFYFDKPDYLSFWMKNTLIPLQIVFINGCKIVDIQEMPVEPDPVHPAKTYISKELADKAIELNPNSINQDLANSQIADLCE